MTVLKLTTIGNSIGAVFPKELLAEMNVSKGDVVYVTKAPGGFRLTPYDPEFATQMDAARKIMKRRRVALRELAK